MRPRRASWLPVSRPQDQRGIALVVALILLVIATLTGISGIRSSTMQERMTGNMYDRSIAFQAAESAFLAAQAHLELTDSHPSWVDCTETACPVVPVNAFSSTNTSGWIDAEISNFHVNAGLSAGAPQFFIQRLGAEVVSSGDALELVRSDNCRQYGANCEGLGTMNMFRVTVRSATPTANNDRSVVVLSGIVRRGM
ncbi:MAG: PilX N-terminal domain-containing pilus assembly protein [Rhodocyclaceae bacterium]